MSNGVALLVADNQGIYIPKIFAMNLADAWEDIVQEDLEILKEGPENHMYWDVWSDMMSFTHHVDSEGNKWYLWQDGDLWAVCPDLMNDEEYEEFFGEPRT